MTSDVERITRSRRDLPRWRNLDWTLVIAFIGIAFIGVMMVYSSTRGGAALRSGTTTYFLQRQAMFVALGVVVCGVTAAIDYHRWMRFTPILVIGTVVLLLAVISPLGTKQKGAQAWFQVAGFQLQPAEFAKFVLIVAFASLLGAQRGSPDTPIVLRCLIGVGVPIGLILLQPDLGTAVVIGIIAFVMLALSGVHWRMLLVLALLAITGGVMVVQLGVLQTYQLDRLTSFLNPSTDVRDAGYNVDQAKITIGSGGIAGKGLFNGTQTKLDYVSEQHTDFIFTVVGEELGFAGGATVIGLYLVICVRLLRLMRSARDEVGALICAGVLAMIGFQVFENIGMTMGLMPVTGIPLPLMSYGGSSTIATFACIGLVINVSTNRFDRA
ncbi:MAG: rod shape-determining protein RodA [Acidimicrobiia bacterium]